MASGAIVTLSAQVVWGRQVCGRGGEWACGAGGARVED
jgi:hypothetical protein